jgi:large subunit ribosomal protein L18e
MSVKAQNKLNQDLRFSVDSLLKISRENNSPIWREIAVALSGPRRNYAAVNVGKLSKICNQDDVIVVPGKILGSGIFDKKIKVSSLFISEKALRKLSEAGSEFIPLEKLAEEKPKGTGVKIIR